MTTTRTPNSRKTRSRRTGQPEVDRQAREDERHRKLQALHDQLTDQVLALVNGEQWQAMLAMAARAHAYSWRNVLLILTQFPDATRVAGYRTWQSLGRQVRTGERGIAVLAPVTYRTTNDDPDNRADTGAAGDGETDGPGERGAARRVLGFKIEHVFDISQTDGDPLPHLRPALPEGEAPEGPRRPAAGTGPADGRGPGTPPPHLVDR